MFRLRRVRKKLIKLNHLYQKRKSTLPPEISKEIQTRLQKIQEAILKHDITSAKQLLWDVSIDFRDCFKKTFIETFWDTFETVAILALILVVIRPMIFELYQVPTGSMRPTIEELDRVFVSKTNFGINVPFTAKQFYFNPNLTQRGGTFVFTAEGLPLADAKVRYFYFIPGTKQLVKRMMAKPGDTLYFYGGKIYGMDADRNPTLVDYKHPSLEKVTTVPYIWLQGKREDKRIGPNIETTFSQMNIPWASIRWNPTQGIVSKKSLLGKDSISSYWGLGNYAMVSILPIEEFKKHFPHETKAYLPDSKAVVLVKHHASLNDASITMNYAKQMRAELGESLSFLPLNENQLQTLFKHMKTTRFIVKNGKVQSWYYDKSYQLPNHLKPSLDYPDGIYEWENGKLYQILVSGIRQLVDNPRLTQFDEKRTIFLFNVGSDWIHYNNVFKPTPLIDPNRYAFFRDGDFYLLDEPVVAKKTEELALFEHNEYIKQANSALSSYEPFEDEGAPLHADGTLDRDKLETYGLTIPSGVYLALGDNYSHSNDSRDFGFIPENNIRGAPSFIFWPYGSRFGSIQQPPYPWINGPKLILWGGLIIILGYLWIRGKKRNRFPIKF